MRRRAVAPTPERTLAVRGLVASVVAVVVAGLLVARGAGALDSGAVVTATLPPDAGRVPVHAPVHHQGVEVGDVRASEGVRTGDDDEPGTRIEMLIGSDHIDAIAADVVVRVVPRTLFGDVRLDLVPPATGDATARTAPTAAALSDGDSVPADRSAEAVQLYDVFTRANDLLVSIRPERLQVALTAMARALDGRGEMLGRVIEDADRAGEHLSPALENAASASGDIAYLAEDLASAGPEIVGTLEEATRLSQVVLDRPGSLSRLLDAGLAATRSGALAADRTVPGAITLAHDTGEVFDRTATDPHGVIRTLYALRPMGEAGTAAFSTGRFAITAVPSFADPMPYGPEDCPRYPGLDGSTCGPPGGGRAGGGQGDGERPGPTVRAAGERDALRELQAVAAGGDPGPGAGPSPDPGLDPAADADPEADPGAAAWTMLAPLVRGTEVTVR